MENHIHPGDPRAENPKFETTPLHIANGIITEEEEQQNSWEKKRNYSETFQIFKKSIVNWFAFLTKIY